MTKRTWAVALALLAIAVALLLWLRPGEEDVSDPQVPPSSAKKRRFGKPPARRLGRVDPPRSDVSPNDTAKVGAIAGRVVDWWSEEPVQGAEVSFINRGVLSSTTSDKDGHFYFEPHEQGTFHLASVLADGYHPYSPEFGQSPVQFVTRPHLVVDGVEIHLIPKLVLNGRVVTGDGDAVPRPSVRILGGDSPELALAEHEPPSAADEAGRFDVTAPLGTWVEASHPTFGVGRAQIDQQAMARRALVIRLSTERASAGGSIAGVVLDSRGTGIEGASVAATSRGVGPGAHTTTDDDGAFELLDLPVDNYRVEAKHPDYAPVWAQPVPTGTKGLKILLSPGGAIEGHVTTTDGEAVSAATVIALRHTSPLVRTAQAHVTVFDAEGSYRIDGLPPGLYDVVGASQRRAVARVVDVDVGTEVAVVDIELPAGGSVVGHVLDESTRNPLPVARVEIESAIAEGSSVAPVRAAALTDEDGRYEIAGVEPGRHSITAYARGHGSRTVSGVEVSTGRETGPIAIDLTTVPDGEETAQFDIVGIGATVRATDDVIEIVNVVDGSGALAAGLQAGDHILAVDGVLVPALGLEGGVEALRGQEGTQVLLTVMRGGAEPMAVLVTRSRVRG